MAPLLFAVFFLRQKQLAQSFLVFSSSPVERSGQPAFLREPLSPPTPSARKTYRFSLFERSSYLERSLAHFPAPEQEATELHAASQPSALRLMKFSARQLRERESCRSADQLPSRERPPRSLPAVRSRSGRASRGRDS